MRSRTIAIASSIAALSFAAAPIAAVAATTHHSPTSSARIDRSRDSRDVRHVDKTRDSSRDTSSADSTRDR
jgi:Ni/Co efflux regulator RcnB